MTDEKLGSSRNQSAKTLLWLSGTLILIGLVVMSPAAGLFCFAVAVLSAAGALLLARGTVRIASIVIAVGALVLVAVTWPAYKAHMDNYIQATSD